MDPVSADCVLCRTRSAGSHLPRLRCRRTGQLARVRIRHSLPHDRLERAAASIARRRADIAGTDQECPFGAGA